MIVVLIHGMARAAMACGVALVAMHIAAGDIAPLDKEWSSIWLLATAFAICSGPNPVMKE